VKIFLDSADLNEIKKAAELGVCDGVTTNPTLIAKSGHDFKWVVAEICKLIPGPISAEVVSTDSVGMLKEADELIKIHENIVIKLPLTPEGLKTCKALSIRKIKTNISPFIGRLDDVSVDGMDLIRDIRKIYSNYGFQTQILAASIRHPRHVIDSALAGADVATCPMKIIEQLYAHPLTTKGLESFLSDWKASGQKSIV
jgi:transaldolase